VPLAAFASSDPEEARLLLDDFLESTRQDLGGLEAARARGDLVVVARESHKLKGAALMVGALELANAADQLESAAADRDWPQVGPLAARLADAVERLRLHVAGQAPA
jgi:HPt (histidine-containing phosphotransfer) domain-containing protein